MSDGLKHKTYNAARWSAVDALGTRGVQFVIGIVLARLLEPAQFGLLAMLTVFMAIAQSLLDSGFSAALIQKKEVSQEDAGSVFYFNVVISVVLAGAMCLAGPWIAAFFRQPALTALARGMSLVLVINAFGAVQATLLRRNLDFKVQTQISIVSGVGSGVVGILMAYRGFGVWSLVGQQIAAAILKSAMLWVMNPWRPGFVFCLRSLNHMFGYGMWVMLSGLLNQIFINMYDIVIGRLFSPAALGFYTRARRLEEMPSQTLSQIVTRVSFPVFSAIQDDDVRLKNGLRKAISMLMFANCPVMLGLAVVARPLVIVLLTEKWLPSVPYLQLLCVGGVLLPLHTLNLNMLMAKGRSDLFFNLEVFKKSFVVISILIFWRWGITALICGQIITSMLSYLLNSYYTGKFLKYPAIEQMRDVGMYIVLAAAMAGGVCVLGQTGIESSFWLLITQMTSGFVLYLVLCWQFQLPAFVETVEMAGRRWGQHHRAVAELERILLRR